MIDYPYIQRTENIQEPFTCDSCKKRVSHGLLREWRVDWFQGNCEIDRRCVPCDTKEMNRIKKAKEEHARKQSIKREKWWAKEKPKREHFEKVVQEYCDANGIEIKKYGATGQWSFGKIADWYSTTGTMIARKSQKRCCVGWKHPNKLIAFLEEVD